jgi:hypothetical protein
MRQGAGRSLAPPGQGNTRAGDAIGTADDRLPSRVNDRVCSFAAAPAIPHDDPALCAHDARPEHGHGHVVRWVSSHKAAP